MNRHAEETPEKWRLTKDVSVADVLSIVLAAGAVIIAWGLLDKRITVVEAAVIEMKLAKQIEREELAQRLDRLENKLDRLIERR